LLETARALGIDYRFAVTTTGLSPAPSQWSPCPGGAAGGEAGRFFPVADSSPRIVTALTPDAGAALAANVAVGQCHWWEQAFQATYEALTPPLVNHLKAPGTPWPDDGNAGFLRPDAKLVLLYVSDDDDESIPPEAFYEAFLWGLKGGDRTQISVNAIAGPLDTTGCPLAGGPAPRYLQMTQDTGGVFESICTPDWGASLRRIAGTALGPQLSFRLSAPPGVVSQISVSVNGQAVASGWTYDANTQSVVFDLTSPPPAGAAVDVAYPLGC
jgi:hypothetical protein